MTVEERLDHVEAALAEIRDAVEQIARRLAYLDQKADQTAGQHWDLVDELTDSSSEQPEPEPIDADPPALRQAS